MISLVNMYIPCFLQVVFPYFENNKKLKEGKSPKIKIKGLEKKRSKIIKYGPQKKKEIRIRHESEQVKMPLLFTLNYKNTDYVQLVQISIIHDELNSLILTFHSLNSMF